jgi:DNA end-binding protein Ku
VRTCVAPRRQGGKPRSETGTRPHLGATRFSRSRPGYRERLRKVIDRKRKGQTIEAPKPEREQTPVPDLMEALERTLANVKAGEDPRTAPDEDGDGELAGLSRDELMERAKKAKISGRTKMSKKELAEALAGE